MSEWFRDLMRAILSQAFLVAELATSREAQPRDIKDQDVEENSCSTCLRWPECNGVDEQCPRRNGYGQ